MQANSPVTAPVQKHQNCLSRSSLKRRRNEMINSSCNLTTPNANPMMEKINSKVGIPFYMYSKLDNYQLNMSPSQNPDTNTCATTSPSTANSLPLTNHSNSAAGLHTDNILKLSTPLNPTGELSCPKPLKSKTSCRTRFRTSLKQISRRCLASYPKSCKNYRSNLDVGQPKRLIDYFEVSKNSLNNNATSRRHISETIERNDHKSKNIYETKDYADEISQIHRTYFSECTEHIHTTARCCCNSVVGDHKPLLLSKQHQSDSNTKTPTKKSLRRMLTQTCLNTMKRPIRSKTVCLLQLEKSYPLCTRWKLLDQDQVPSQVRGV